MSKLDILNRNADYLNAYHEVCQLVAKHQVYISQGKMVEQITLWADRPDSYFKAPWGAYKGIDSIRRCFMVDYGDVRDPRNEEFLKGYMCYQTLTGEFIEVAGDGQTARGKWSATGAVTFGMGARQESARNRGYWNWSGFFADFIQENGVWKLWHIVITPILWAPYDTVWGDCEPYYQNPLRETTEDETPEKIFNYTYECVPAREGIVLPAPKPYKTWSDVAPGYGFLKEEV